MEVPEETLWFPISESSFSVIEMFLFHVEVAPIAVFVKISQGDVIRGNANCQHSSACFFSSSMKHQVLVGFFFFRRLSTEG